MSDPNPSAATTVGSTTNVQPSKEDAPQWARDAISSANSEAAKFRIERNEARDQLTQALSKIDELTAKNTELTGQVGDAEKAMMRYTVAVNAGIPGDKANEFAALLKGGTVEELSAHANELLGIFGTQGQKNKPATDPSQGQGGGNITGLSEGGAYIHRLFRS